MQVTHTYQYFFFPRQTTTLQSVLINLNKIREHAIKSSARHYLAKNFISARIKSLQLKLHFISLKVMAVITSLGMILMASNDKMKLITSIQVMFSTH